MAPRLTLSRLWVLCGYEIVRTLDQKTGRRHEEIQETKALVERIRVLLAKLEPARKHRKTDLEFAMPIHHHKDGVGWLTNQPYFVTRRALADKLLQIGKAVVGNAQSVAQPDRA